MNNITIELCAEDRARIDRLTEALEAMAKQQPRQLYALDLGSAPENDAQAAEAAEPEQTPPKTEKPAEPKNENVSKAPEVTVEDLRSKYMSLSASTKEGVKDQARNIIKDYASKISLIPADKRAEVLEKLTSLEG